MTPKEKALQLIGKMCLNDCTDENIKLAKQFALIAVNEILMANPHSNPFYLDIESTMGFWNGVRAEIENL